MPFLLWRTCCLQWGHLPVNTKKDEKTNGPLVSWRQKSEKKRTEADGDHSLVERTNRRQWSSRRHGVSWRDDFLFFYCECVRAYVVITCPNSRKMRKIVLVRALGTQNSEIRTGLCTGLVTLFLLLEWNFHFSCRISDSNESVIRSSSTTTNNPYPTTLTLLASPSVVCHTYKKKNQGIYSECLTCKETEL